MALPQLRLRILPKFPARVLGVDGIAIDRSGGTYTIRQDWSGIAPAVLPADIAQMQLLVRDTALDEFVTIDGDDFLAPVIPVFIADQPTAEAGVSNTTLMSPLRTKQQIDARLSDEATAEAGSDNSDLMTPLRTSQHLAAKTGTTAGTVAAGNDSRFGTVPDGYVTDAKVATQVDPADLVDGNKIRFDDGLGGPAMPLVTRDRRWMWITDTDQITGNGTSDDQVGVEAAVAKACANDRVLLIPDDITIRCTAPIYNDGFKPLRIRGSGVEPQQSSNYNAGGVSLRGAGSWFYLDHAGMGFILAGRADGSGTVGDCQNSIRGIGTIRAQPTPGVGWAPNDHDFDFDFAQCSGDLDDITMWNASRGVRYRNGRTGRLDIGTIRGQPLKIGIEVVNAYDVVRIRDMHFWPFWSLDANVEAYTLANADAIISRRNDGMMVGNAFAIRYRRLLLVGHFVGDGGDNPGGTTYHASFGNLYADLVESAVVVDAAADGFTAHIDQIISEQNAAVTAAGGSVVVLGPNAKLHIGTLVSNNTNGPVLQVSGVDSKVSVASLQPGVWNRSGATFPGVYADASGAVIKLGEVLDIGSGGGQPLLSESGGARVTGHRACGQGTVPNGASGVTVTHGMGVAPKGVTFDLIGAGAQGIGSFIPRVSDITATTFTVDLGVAASADRLFGWEAFF